MANDKPESNPYVDELINELARREAEKMALVAEFSKASDPDAIADTAKAAIKDLLPTAVTTMKDLIINSPSDGVRAGLARFVFSVALDKTKLEDETDGTIRKLLAQLGAETEVDPSTRKARNTGGSTD